MVAQKQIVQVSDAKLSRCPDDVLATYSLGSCIGVCLYDPVACIGGLLHYQLPSSQLDPPKAQANPFMFADSGMHWLMKNMLSAGAQPKRLQVKIAGGATMQGGPNGFEIGKRNHLAIRKIAWKHRLFIESEDVGGTSARHMSLTMANGEVLIKSNGIHKFL